MRLFIVALMERAIRRNFVLEYVIKLMNSEYDTDPSRSRSTSSRISLVSWSVKTRLMCISLSSFGSVRLNSGPGISFSPPRPVSLKCMDN